MKLISIIVGAALAALCGCTAITPVQQQYSGFLGDYNGLQPVQVADGSKAMRWVNPELKKGKYKKIIVPQVAFFPAPRASSQVSLETLTQISLQMTQQLRAELGKQFTVTDKPGPDTANFQIAITGVDTPTEGLKPYEIIPIALVFASASTATGARDHVSVVYVEGIATDALTGEELAKGVRQGVGLSLENDQEKLSIQKLKPLIDGWAKEMGQLSGNLL